ncbi:ATP-binding cassette domain-containing protein, partial [Acinetobacter baumannii]|nr:ATP-binding cassette domain-containing protein [Acinetobacter baumannii]
DMDVLTIEHLTKKIGNKTILEDVSFKLKRGQIVGLVGANGAGKTTLMTVILGYSSFQSGNFNVINSKDSKSNIGALIENPGIYPFMSGYENLKLLNESKNTQDIDKIVSQLHMDEYIHKKAKTYSLGMKQKLGIAIAFLNKPQFIILDEPMNDLDPKAVRDVRELIVQKAQEGVTFLISSHILSELVKIDPKSIGVGQYQHDVNQKALENALTFVVETAVNQVGVDVNTASSSLLQYVSGLSSQIAKNIIAYREENGAIKHNKELSKIKRLGAKTFEQSIGFLRIVDGSEPLDNTSIHPESYKVTYQLLDKFGFGGNDLGSDALKAKLNSLDMDELAIELQVGVPTLEDIIKSLKAPNRDPRDEFETPILKSDVLSIEDLQEGMKLSGTVRNVVDFGAFVDIGVKQDGLVHVSKLSKKFVKNPMDIVSVGDIVDVWIYSIDKN